jgi:hypothetical protein
MWGDLDETADRLSEAAKGDQVGDASLETDFLAICTFIAIGLVLSFRAVLGFDGLPGIMALL